MITNEPYKWKKSDKTWYLFSMIPFLLAVIGAIYIMTPICIFMTILWLLIYVVLNIFQAGCCVACPYRGQYCPAIFGVYISNLLSEYMYNDYDVEPGFHRRHEIGAMITLIVFLLYPVYWMFITAWYFPLVYLALLLAHVALFMPIQCRKCSYQNKCPGGKMYSSICKKCLT